MAEARLQVIAGGAVPQEPLTTDPWQFQTMCVDAFVASWRARGFSPVTIDNDIGLLERRDDSSPEWHRGPQPYAAEPQADAPQPHPRRRTWPYVAAIAALGITIAGVYQYAADDQKHQERQEKAAAYKGRAGAALQVDGVNTNVVAQWSSDRDRVVVELRSYFDRNAKYLRIDSSEQSAYSTLKDSWYPKDPQIELPVTDPRADVTVRIAVGGKTWKTGARAQTRTIRLSPTGVAYDGDTGTRLPTD
jgi:hypothetical protein